MVTKSGLYPCNNYCDRDKGSEFSKQEAAFGEISRIIQGICFSYKTDNVTLNTNDSEKYFLFQQIEMLQLENTQMRNALKEVVNRLNAGGQGLMGYINF